MVFADKEIATTGDSSGNLSFGLTPEELKLFPEVELNYWVSDGRIYTWETTLANTA